jgi:hypothetical protein
VHFVSVVAAAAATVVVAVVVDRTQHQRASILP